MSRRQYRRSRNLGMLRAVMDVVASQPSEVKSSTLPNVLGVGQQQVDKEEPREFPEEIVPEAEQVYGFTRVEHILGLEVHPKGRWVILGYEMTPDKAAAILAQASKAYEILKLHPRKIRDYKVRAYALVWERGEWRNTHQGISIDVRGMLSDGTHRLTCCAKYGLPIRIDIHFNQAKEDFTYYDRGINRDVGDDLTFSGLITAQQKSSVQSAIRILQLLDVNLPPWSRGHSYTLSIMTLSDAEDILDRHPAVLDWCRWLEGFSKSERRLIPPGILIAFMVVFSEVDKERAEVFCEQVLKQSHPSPNNPTRVLARTLMQMTNDRNRHIKDRESTMCLLVRAWNNFIEDETKEITKLFSRSDDGRLPKIRGWRPSTNK